MSQPTVQSIQFDVQVIFLFDVNSLGNCMVALFVLDLDVDAPTFTPLEPDADDPDGPGF